jgi:copper resistance protein D
VSMAQFLDIFGFLSVILRGLALAFEALTVGGIIFQLFIAREYATSRAWHWIRSFAILLAATQLCVASANTAILLQTTGLALSELLGADFCIATMCVIAAAIAIAILARPHAPRAMALFACVVILFGSTMMSHSAGRLSSRLFLIGLTLIHHTAGAAWVGGMLYLLIALRQDGAAIVVARFSQLAIVSVTCLVVAGIGMGWLYTGSPEALGGTTYGAMLLAKVVLTGMLLLLGALNLKIVRSVRSGDVTGLFPLRRFAEAELGIGITVLLAAASMTSTPPAVDVRSDRVTAHEVAERMTPRWPRMETPAFADLSPAQSLTVPQDSNLPGSFVPGQLQQPNTPADIAWSEYNHHWAGLVVLAIGLLALLSRRFRWAIHWPLAFFGLALFLLVRADSENWPLGPRGFWESFQVAEVAQHRLFVLLIIGFAIFEWAVQTNRLAPQRAGLVFPLVCAVGGALLLTHSHSLGNVKEEFLAELSHIPLAIFAVAAGWCRWLEIRLPGPRTRIAAGIWPVFFMLIGTALLLYRES